MVGVRDGQVVRARAAGTGMARKLLGDDLFTNVVEVGTRVGEFPRPKAKTGGLSRFLCQPRETGPFRADASRRCPEIGKVPKTP